jgi:hypothetical protein
MRRLALAATLALLAHPTPARADEGMWTFDAFPSAEVKARYGFEPTQRWLDHVRLSSARLAGGCSASFVSQNGLVLTNHHCAHSCIEQVSSAEHDYVASGFFATEQKDELLCPEIEINRLESITDVTAQLTAATKGLDGKAFNEAQRAEKAKLEKACAKSVALRCEVITLYHGGAYHLYQYRRFQDVRLVAAPEFAMAFFGGDPDNFEFPRYDLDFSFLRVYEDGKPARTPDFLPLAPQAPADGALVFVSGNPGGTNRLTTIAELELDRDRLIPDRLLYTAELRGLLTEFARRSAEHKRISSPLLFGLENGYKARLGRLQALRDATVIQARREAELELRRRVEGDPALKAVAGGAWETIEKATQRWAALSSRLMVVEYGQGFNSQLYSLARQLVRAASELEKSNEKRLPEFADARLPQLRQRLLSSAPIYDELEKATLGFGLTMLRRQLGADDALVRKVLGERSPEELAETLISGCTLKDVAARRALLDGGRQAIEASRDPMVVLARLVDPDSRAIRTTYEDEVEAPIKRASEAIAKAYFAVHGKSTYPDATFTLRLSYGRIAGWTEPDGRVVPPYTDFGGAFARATGRDPFKLPDSWLRARAALDPGTPFDVATTNDIIGGNSGSPLLDQKGRLVGLVFDGNIYSLAGDYFFEPGRNRTVAVTSVALLEALDHVYKAQRLHKELSTALTAK